MVLQASLRCKKLESDLFMKEHGRFCGEGTRQTISALPGVVGKTGFLPITSMTSSVESAYLWRGECSPGLFGIAQIQDIGTLGEDGEPSCQHGQNLL